MILKRGQYLVPLKTSEYRIEWGAERNRSFHEELLDPAVY